MKNSITFLAFILVIAFAYAQDKPTTHMYERIYLTPKPDKIKMLNQNLSVHNKKYHGEGIHYAFVQSVITGRRSGDYVWAKSNERVYEYACHEGNYALGSIMKGARLLEKEAGSK